MGPQNGPKSIPKSLRNRVPILTRLRVQICSVLGALWAPQNRPKIASRTLWAHLAVLKLHLGASRSPHAHFGSSWAHLDPPGGRFWLHFGASWAILDPTKVFNFLKLRMAPSRPYRRRSLRVSCKINKYSFYNMLQDLLQDLHICAALRTENSRMLHYLFYNMSMNFPDHSKILMKFRYLFFRRDFHRILCQNFLGIVRNSR